MCVSMMALCAITLTAFMPALSKPPKNAAKTELSLKNLDGKRARLGDYQGKILVLNFWATWCASCKQEMRMLVEMEKEYGARGIVFVGVSLDDEKTQNKIQAFLREFQVTFPICADPPPDPLATLGI